MAGKLSLTKGGTQRTRSGSLMRGTVVSFSNRCLTHSQFNGNTANFQARYKSSDRKEIEASRKDTEKEKQRQWKKRVRRRLGDDGKRCSAWKYIVYRKGGGDGGSQLMTERR